MARCKHSIDASNSKDIQFFRFSSIIQTLFSWERKGELYTSYYILIEIFKNKSCVVVSLVTGQNTSRQLATRGPFLEAPGNYRAR